MVTAGCLYAPSGCIPQIVSMNDAGPLRTRNPVPGYIYSRHNDSTRPFGNSFSCEQQNQASDINIGLELECIERHRASLPLATWYERIEQLAENRPMVAIMNGLDEVSRVANRTLQGTNSY